jgi:hypothetical protein
MRTATVAMNQSQAALRTVEERDTMGFILPRKWQGLWRLGRTSNGKSKDEIQGSFTAFRMTT